MTQALPPPPKGKKGHPGLSAIIGIYGLEKQELSNICHQSGIRFSVLRPDAEGYFLQDAMRDDHIAFIIAICRIRADCAGARRGGGLPPRMKLVAARGGYSEVVTPKTKEDVAG